MKFLAKLAAAGVVAGAAATLYGAPDVAGDEPAEVAAIRASMLEDQRFVLQLKAQALREKDIIKLNCVNDKLVVLLPQLNIADDFIGRLSSASADTQGQIMTDLQATAKAVHEQREAAAGCADVKLIITESSNTFTAPPDLENPTDPLPEPGDYIEPPGYASPDR